VSLSRLVTGQVDFRADIAEKAAGFDAENRCTAAEGVGIMVACIVDCSESAAESPPVPVMWTPLQQS
jgi:hypothetical protein